MSKNRGAVVLTLAFLLVLHLAYADYIDADARLYVLNSTNVTVKGYIRLDNTSGINSTNVTGYLGNSNFTIFTNTSNNWTIGFFEFNLTAPNSTGRFNVTINTSALSENIEIRVGNFSNVVFNFTDKRPPFANGSFFLVNISFSGLSGNAPRLEIFSPNAGNSSGWVINNLSSRLNAGSILYNITVPANADGRYMVVFDEGAGVTIFLVKATLIAVANVQDSENSTTTSFGQRENITIIGKIRDENNAITNANVTAFITLPNGAVFNITLTHNGTGTDGTYNGTFTNTALTGDYKIEIVANVSGKIVRSTSAASVQSLEGKLDIVKDFFFDFGSQSAFQRNGPVEFNALVYNLSNDILLNGSMTTNSGADVNCTAIRVIELKNILNNSAVSSPSLTKSLGLFFGQNMCKLRFTAPDADGIYSLTVNASVGSSQTNNMSVLATGYFAVQSYILKVSPISSIGGGKEFMSFLMPGDNATFELAVRNLSSNGTAVAGNLITNFNVTKITPMDFIGGGQSEIINFTGLTGAFTAGTASSNPKAVIKVPENRTGPFQIEFQATVGGSVIRGSAFYFARYVEGFVFPGSFGGGMGTGFSEGGGEEGPPGSSSGFEGGNFRCSGAQNFSAKVFDVRTRQAAKNVIFNSIQEAREELTGRSVRNSLTLSSSTSTDSNGFGNLTLNFSGSFSGFHFMLINITTADGKSDTLPGGFECRQLSFFPQIQAIGSTGSGGFFVAPTSGINMIISGIKNLNTRNNTVNGTVNIVRLESFDPSKGPKFGPGLSDNFPIINGIANITVVPGNFSGLGGKWFNGFNDFVIRVCDNNNNTNAADDVCDTSFGGFMVVAFDAFPDFGFGSPMQTLTAGQNVTYNIMARTNVTNFTVQVGLPWEGSVQDAAVVNYSLKSDGWNNSAQIGFDNFERWNVTFTVPASVRKGGNMIIIKVNNYLGETTDVMLFGTASKLSVSVPDTEGVNLNFGAGANISVPQQVTDFRNSYNVNLTAINSTYNVYSKSGQACVKVGFNTTRFGMFEQTVVYSNLANTSAFLVDNRTAGVYDTLVVSVSNGSSIAVAHAGNRSLASAGFSNLYFIKTEGCGFALIVNSGLNGTGFGAGYGGQHAVNTSALIPIIVKQGTTPKVNVSINVSQMIQQNDVGESRGGFGFSGFLGSNEFSSIAGTTDSNGMAFLRLNVSRSGFYSVIWNFDDSGDTDVADFSEGIPIEIKSFRADGGLITGNHPSNFRVVTLARTAENGLYNVTKLNNNFYLGTWNEATQGTFINDNSVNNLTIVLRNVTQQPGGPFVDIPDFSDIIIDNDTLFNVSLAEPPGDMFSPVSFNWTDQRTIGSDTLAVHNNQTVDANTIKLVFANPNMFPNTFIFNTGSSTRVDRNITARACAFTFSQPQTPLIGANVSSLITQSFSFSGPPTIENLTMYDPFTNNTTLSVLTGPSGCATFNVSRSLGWKSGSPNEIKGTITSGSSQEQSFMGSIFVSCPATGSCF